MATFEAPTPPPGTLPRTNPSATHWSLIRAACDAGSPRHDEALSDLVQRYWRPLYAFARRRGSSPDDAQDLTQGFLGGFLEKNTVLNADPARGRFRTFLLTCFRNYLTNEHARARTARRGGNVDFVSLDAASAESRYLLEPADSDTPDQAYDRQWALGTLERAFATVRDEYVAAGKSVLHDRLRSLLWEDAVETTYKELGACLKLSEAAVKMAVVRLRQRSRLALFDEVARTVPRKEDVEDEYRHLMAVLRE